MRTILVTATAAILALGLSACNNNDTTASAPSSVPSSAAPVKASPSTPTQHDTTPTNHDAQPTEVGEAAGELTYLAPGKFQVGDTVFFTADDTVLIVAGGKCPDGAARPDNRCTTDNMEMWAQSAQRLAKVTFDGQTATVIREVNDI
ncbi:hypothetical protein OG417_47930 [Actinoallomurus sp. NBC_01490]|uniref:hypothetical protein n=1 Tax=Actinoallomurus sp. NBC_01490 TaxID=2903557 RepID=UPI002E36458C|nr:hypothetical protein [Actinoallomurus sp. NBC_01490]